MRKTFTRQVPYVCPVCTGRGLMWEGFYTERFAYPSGPPKTGPQCHSCSGSGIVYGTEIGETTGNWPEELRETSELPSRPT
jgi:hypothetical protein